MKYRYVEFQDTAESAQYRSAAAWLYDIVTTFVVTILILGIIVCFVGKSARVSGQSMSPTLSDQDQLLIVNLTNKYQRGDIVVIGRGSEKTLIKRIIAMEGDTIDINFQTGQVFLNGELLQEPYVAEPTYLSYGDGPTFPVTVPTGYAFVMGDNRNDSLDSRSGEVGLIPVQSIIGKMAWNFGHYAG